MVEQRSDPASKDSRTPITTVAPPTLGLPKSGGALRGLGETFRGGGPTGTGSYRIPLPLSPCRGVAPALALDYDSGKGQSVFGAGWSLALPKISRRTDKGVPRYWDSADSDLFLLGGDELVPSVTSGTRTTSTDGDDRVDAYRPRVESAFARIERRTNTTTGDVHWRAITASNVTSYFGLTTAARVADPANPLHVFRWLLEATFDSLGNATWYEYKAEDLVGAPARDGNRVIANAHPKRVHYGNRTPLTTRDPAAKDFSGQSWLFEVVFDYGEHTTDLPAEASPWAVRPDPFSTFRASFDQRTYRLCQRVLMFHEMPEQLGEPARLVKALELTYDASPTITYLTSVRQAGYAWNAQNQVTVAYMPTVALDYTRIGTLSTSVVAVDRASIAQLPGGIDDATYQLVDLDGEGIAGILEAGPHALSYKCNLGGGHFAPAKRLELQPAMDLANAHLVSLAADGRLDVAVLGRPTPGFYERTRDESWRSFKPFHQVPNIDWRARGVHLLDVDGDGLTDVLIAQDDVFVWYPSHAREGFGAPSRITQAHDPDRGAVVLTTDDVETIFLADVTGDGLADLVRIRNGEIHYWPNLGYGRFGTKIAMTNAPVFDTPDLFEPRRIRFGDIDGTGTTDLVYLSRGGATIYLNQSGNGFADGVVIPVPLADVLASVRVADLLGTGTACLVWSSAAPADSSAPLRYVDLLRSTKPHLLCSVANGLGAETRITYAPSTQYYLEDRAAGHPWATRLPFVVQTVARVETTDAIAGSQSVLRYRYAHGFFDGVEREFRGFARVDSWDAEAVSATGAPPAVPATDGQFRLPPVHTISWFHTGAWDGEGLDLRAALAKEFYDGDSVAAALPSTTFPASASPADSREQHRALKGKPLRQEVYAEDGSTLAENPYSVAEYRYEVRELQPVVVNAPGPFRTHPIQHGAYYAFEREAVTYSYERDPSDPRIGHHLTLEVDALGHVVRDAQVAYARRTAAEPEQARVLATCGQATFAAPIATTYDYRHGVATEGMHYELAVSATSTVQPFATIDAAMTSSTTLPFDGTLAANTKRVLEHVQNQFWADDLSAALPQGSVATRALPYDHRALALPQTLVTSVFGTTITAADLTAAGYASPDGDYWMHSGTTTYDATSFYQATSFTDPFGNTSRVVVDDYKLFVVEEHTSANASFDNVTTATIDYRVLGPSLVTDPNGNRSAAAFDELGMVTAVALMGRNGANEGDTLADPTVKLDYDWFATPAYVHTSARREHGSANTGWLESYSYSDGSGHEILKKVMAAPGSDNAGRWIGSGRVVFDNKGNAVKKYEPYFAPSFNYDADAAIATTAYCAIATYDALSRVIRTDIADGTFATTTFDAWSQTASDANDNVLASAWYADASTRPATDPLYRAAQLAAKHANTPTVTTIDAIGRAFLVTADNGTAGKLLTRTALDIQGNVLSVTDPLGNVVVTQTFDVRGHALRSIGADTGTALAITDGVSKPLRAWDARGYMHRSVYDLLHRPTQLWTTPPSQSEFLAQVSVYGEGLSQPDFRGHVYLQFDGSGVVANTSYDFEGHVTSATRQFTTDYTTTPSWSALASLTDPTAFLPAAASSLSADTFITTSSYDALGHVVSATTPDGSVTTSTFDVGGKLAAVASALRGASTSTQIVASIQYEANGQRTSVSSGSGLVSTYIYDERNHRIISIGTTRQSDGASLQSLAYTHDPVGNIVEIDDAAQETVYFNGTVTSGTQQFAYDAIYQLISASGREQPGQVGYALGANGYPEAPLSALPHPNDTQALVPYSEAYTYDAAGNLLATAHTAPSANWTRTQTIAAGTNRLATMSLPGDPSNGPFTGTFTYDATGNMTKMPNLAAMAWDHAGRFVEADLGGGGNSYFTYDAGGQRARKVVVRGGKVLERLYIGSFERYREMNAATLAVSLERQSLHINDGERRFVLIETKTVDTSVTSLTPTPLFRYQLPNQIQSSCVEADATGSMISYEEYYPYGGSSFRAGDADKRYRFAGKERDEETGLYCLGVRYFAPWTARWTSADPVGFAGSANLYAYCKNSPAVYTDMDGRQPQLGPGIPDPFSAEVSGEWSKVYTNPEVYKDAGVMVARVTAAGIIIAVAPELGEVTALGVRSLGFAPWAANAIGGGVSGVITNVGLDVGRGQWSSPQAYVASYLLGAGVGYEATFDDSYVGSTVVHSAEQAAKLAPLTSEKFSELSFDVDQGRATSGAVEELRAVRAAQSEGLLNGGEISRGEDGADLKVPGTDVSIKAYRDDSILADKRKFAKLVGSLVADPEIRLLLDARALTGTQLSNITDALTQRGIAPTRIIVPSVKSYLPIEVRGPDGTITAH
ncbi:MAG TPA: SpvB/TcaC N-terminal domain-containing protein [Kofleriaceae bacterium]|jgi:RHS repeat-associated protein